MISPVGGAVSAVRGKICQIKIMIWRGLFLMSWTMCHAELALLHAEDLTVYRRLRCRNRFFPERWRRLEQIESIDCYHWFGLYPYDLKRLFLSLRIPMTLRCTTSRHVLDGEECFIIYMYHINKGTPFTAMARHTFGGDLGSSRECLKRWWITYIAHFITRFRVQAWTSGFQDMSTYAAQ